MDYFQFNGIHLLICFLMFAFGLVAGIILHKAYLDDKKSEF